MWKTLHPSEDGEALFNENIEHSSKRSEDRLPGFAEPIAGPQWYAVYTTSRHEKRVAEHLGVREIEHYLPLYRSDRKWRDGTKVALDLPLFPSYLFVKMERNERRRVLEVPGALTVVGGIGGDLAPVQQTAIDALRTGLREKRIEPHPLTTVGQRVRIHSGAFAGMEGIVARKKNYLRVVLTLELIMQSIAVEVSEAEIESAHDTSASKSKYAA